MDILLKRNAYVGPSSFDSPCLSTIWYPESGDVSTSDTPSKPRETTSAELSSFEFQDVSTLVDILCSGGDIFLSWLKCNSCAGPLLHLDHGTRFLVDRTSTNRSEAK